MDSKAPDAPAPAAPAGLNDADYIATVASCIHPGATFDHTCMARVLGICNALAAVKLQRDEAVKLLREWQAQHFDDGPTALQARTEAYLAGVQDG